MIEQLEMNGIPLTTSSYIRHQHNDVLLRAISDLIRFRLNAAAAAAAAAAKKCDGDCTGCVTTVKLGLCVNIRQDQILAVWTPN